MKRSSRRYGPLLGSVCLLLACTSAFAGESQRVAHPASAVQTVSAADIVQYMRDRFMLPDSVKVDAEPLGKSQFSVFLQTVVTTDDGKQKQSNNVFITKDGRCFVLGNLFALRDPSTAEFVRCLREAAKLPPQAELKIGAFNKTPYPQFLKAVATASVGKQTQSVEVFVTKDHQIGLWGVIFPFRNDVVRGMIKTHDMPSQGPSNAPITLVEYADLQCQYCARLQEFLEKQLLPKYGDKIRVIFKEYPIPGHDWSPTAAVANECAYEINASVFPAYRTLIFANQGAINATNVRDRLLELGDQAGIDHVKLAACIDTQASLPRVEAGREEGRDLGVDHTPTSFVNGRIVVGMPPESAWDKILDEALVAKNH